MSETPSNKAGASEISGIGSLMEGISEFAKDKNKKAGKLLKRTGEIIKKADTGLDQTKKEISRNLEDLKTKGKLKDIAAHIYQTAEEGFRKDLDEIGIRGEAQNEYIALFKKSWEEKEMSKRSNEILNSPELAAMDSFIGDLENLPKLKEKIDNAEPVSGIESWIKGLAAKYLPGSEDFINEYFGDIMGLLGLGSLIKKKKGEKAEDKKSEDKNKDKDKNEKEESDEEDETITESVAESDEKMKPVGPTLFFGDSLTQGMTKNAGDKLKINVKIGSIAKKSASSKWGLEKIKDFISKSPEKLKDMENAVILFGTNDLRNPNPQTTIDNLKEIYKTLKDAGVKKIHAVTIPPFKGYEGYENYDKTNEYRKTVNEWIRNSKDAGFSSNVIDLCKTESEGGLAENNDSEKLSEKADAGDNIHIKKSALAEVYQRELQKQANKEK